MLKKASLCLLYSFLSISAFAQYWGPNRALNVHAGNATPTSAIHQAAQQTLAQRTKEAALNVEFYMSHQYLRNYRSEDELYDWEWEEITLYKYTSNASDPAAFEEDGSYYIESETPLPGRILVSRSTHRVPHAVSREYTYRIECKAYALTENWAVMAGTCLNPQMYTKSDKIFIGGLSYDPEPVNVHLEGNIKIKGQNVSTYYHTAALTLLYAAPNTPLARTLANAPKVNLRIFNKADDIKALSAKKLLVNGKERTTKGKPQNNQVVLDESGFFTTVAGKASDGLFYQDKDNVYLVGFNNGKISSIANIDPDLRHRWGECSRQKSSTYYTFSRNQLNFIKNKTIADWNSSVGNHIYITK